MEGLCQGRQCQLTGRNLVSRRGSGLIFVIKYIATKPQKNHGWFVHTIQALVSPPSTKPFSSRRMGTSRRMGMQQHGSNIACSDASLAPAALPSTSMLCPGPPGRVTALRPSQTNPDERSREKEMQKLKSSLCAGVTGSRKANISLELVQQRQ